MTVLVDLANKPERVPPLERRQFNWVAAHCHNTYLPYAWNERIPAERDTFFLKFIHERMLENVLLIQAYSRMYQVTNHQDENRRVSRFLAHNKRDAIQRFRFVLENLLAVAQVFFSSLLVVNFASGFSFALAFFFPSCRFRLGFFLSPLPFSLLFVNFGQVFSFALAFCNKLLVIINIFGNNKVFVINLLKVYFLCEN